MAELNGQTGRARAAISGGVLVPLARRSPAHSAGITLIELMMVIAILGILAAIALPSYQDSVRKSWRRKATVCLVEMAQGMERRFTTGLDYVADPNDPTGLPPQTCTTDDGMIQYYAYDLTVDSALDTFELRAVPQGGQATGDARCGTLSINQLGVRAVTGTAPVDECW